MIRNFLTESLVEIGDKWLNIYWAEAVAGIEIGISKMILIQIAMNIATDPFFEFRTVNEGK